MHCHWLQPSINLAQIAGCTIGHFPGLGGFLPIHNENMETTVEGIYVAGDSAGIEKASTAMEEGRLAGLDIAQKLGFISEEQANGKKAMLKKVSLLCVQDLLDNCANMQSPMLLNISKLVKQIK